MSGIDQPLDARYCPVCGATGILPLDQPNEDGTTADPVMLCPVCEKEFRADGMTWLGAVGVPGHVDPAVGLTDEQIHQMTEAMATLLWRELPRN
jgi:hypothetical protein